MIKLGLQCTGKASKMDKDHCLEFTVTLERRPDPSVDNEYGALVSGVKLHIVTGSRRIAELFSEGENYSLQIDEDKDLGGVFRNAQTATASQEELPLKRETQEPPEKLMNWEELDELGIYPEYTENGIYVHGPAGCLTPEGDWTKGPPAGYTVEGVNDESHRLARLLATRAARAMATERRAEIRRQAEAILAEIAADASSEAAGEEPDPTGMVDRIAAAMYEERGLIPTAEQISEIRQEVEIVLAERAAKAAGESKQGPEQETLEQKVARITREVVDAEPKDADYSLDDIAFDVANAIDKEEGRFRKNSEFEAFVAQITPLVKAAMEAYGKAQVDTTFDAAIERLTREELRRLDIEPKLVDSGWLTARVVDRLGEENRGKDITSGVIRAKTLVPAVLQEIAEKTAPAGGQEYDEGLRCALLHHYEGAAERWRPLQEAGATDEEIRELLSVELGDGGGSVPGGGWRKHKGGKNPQFEFYRRELGGELVISLKGKALIREVRRVLGIPLLKPIGEKAVGAVEIAN